MKVGVYIGACGEAMTTEIQTDIKRSDGVKAIHKCANTKTMRGYKESGNDETCLGQNAGIRPDSSVADPTSRVESTGRVHAISDTISMG